MVRGDDAPRAAENRFHEMLHVLGLLANDELDHDLIRSYARTYAANQELIDRILNHRN